MNRVLRESVKTLAHKMGYDVVRYKNTASAHFMNLLSHYGIDLLFDIGANTGQYANRIRRRGYKHRLVSFEPLSSAYKELTRNAESDPLWETCNIALGSYDGKAKINISRNSYSSSILDILPGHIRADPDSVSIGREEVTVRKIDSILNDYYRATQNLFLKIDTQGYEKNVLEGAEASLEVIRGIQLEASLSPLYEGETLLVQMVPFMLEKGYRLFGLEPIFYDPRTGRLLQVDCIFFRE